MNNRQRRFAQEYIIDLNATQAAIRAGYSEKTAAAHASRLLINVNMQENIQEAIKERSERTNIRADRVLTELAKIGFANMLDYIDVDGDDVRVDLQDISRDQAAAISEIVIEERQHAEIGKRVKFKLLDKRAALVDIGRHLGMFVDRQELTGADGKPVEVTQIERVIVHQSDKT
ncbi:MAG: terminase small subunit [Alphaproteobacteria bacterium]|nr:terminase small subunit [Alphaproteobacteria bacterium]